MGTKPAGSDKHLHLGMAAAWGTETPVGADSHPVAAGLVDCSSAVGAGRKDYPAGPEHSWAGRTDLGWADHADLDWADHTGPGWAGRIGLGWAGRTC